MIVIKHLQYTQNTTLLIFKVSKGAKAINCDESAFTLDHVYNPLLRKTMTKAFQEKQQLVHSSKKPKITSNLQQDVVHREIPARCSSSVHRELRVTGMGQGVLISNTADLKEDVTEISNDF